MNNQNKTNVTSSDKEENKKETDLQNSLYIYKFKLINFN